MKSFKISLLAAAAVVFLASTAQAQITTNSPGADINSPTTNANNNNNVVGGGTAIAGGGTALANGGTGLGIGVGLGGDGGAGGSATVVTAPIIAPITNVSPDIRVTGPTTTVAPDMRTTTTVSPTIRTDVNTTDITAVTTRVDPTLINGQQQDAHNQQAQTAVGGTATSISQGGAGGSAQQVQSADNKGNTQSVGGQSVTFNEAKQYRAPVNTAYAAPLSIGGGVCAYSAFSAGGSGIGFSASGSVAKIDDGCSDRADADILARLGFQREAAEILKTHPRVAAAFNTVAQADKSKVYGQAPMDPIGDKLASLSTEQVVTGEAALVRKDNTPVKGTMLPIPNE